MTRVAYDRVRAVLGELSAEELQGVAERIAALQHLTSARNIPLVRGGGSARGQADAATFAELLYDALAEGVQCETGVAQPRYGAFLRSRYGKAYTTGAAVAYSGHCTWFPHATRADTVRATRIYARVLLARIAQRGKTTLWQYLARALGELDVLVAGVFPGYAREGLMSMLLRDNVIVVQHPVENQRG